ncbi:MAG: RusA family crossover junction endodeoxyribonuclease [Planctomycetota bacterium]
MGIRFQRTNQESLTKGFLVFTHSTNEYCFSSSESTTVWTEAIVKQTAHLPKISEACIVRVTFFLPCDKFPKDFPYGPDLDNLLKRFLDALNETVFSESKGKDSCILSINATKTKVDSPDESGAFLEILPVSV